MSIPSSYMELFKSDVNYIDAHIMFASAHPKYFPSPYGSDCSTYVDQLKLFYHENPTRLSNEILNICAYRDIYHDTRNVIQIKSVLEDTVKLVHKTVQQVSDEWFVTISFNHDTYDVKQIVPLINRILEFDWILEANGNFEIFRKSGLHPHLHLRLKTVLKKSQIIEKIFRPKYVRKYVYKSQDIDVKKFEEHHISYLAFNKQDDKMEAVRKDAEYRIKHNIPEFRKNC